jgi:hypothetical protein
MLGHAEPVVMIGSSVVPMISMAGSIGQAEEHIEEKPNGRFNKSFMVSQIPYIFAELFSS